MYPLPNVEGTGAGGLTNNYRVQQQAQTDRHNVDFKVNWNRTSAHQIWGKFSQMKALVDDLFTFPIGASDDDGGHTTVRQYTVGHTWSLSPTLLLDSSFGAATQDQFVSSPDFHLGNMGLDLGIPGTNDQGRGDPRYAGLPQFSTGFTALGNTPAWSPIYRHEYSASFNTNLTKVAGRHDLKAGYFLNHLTLDDWQPSVANPRGEFTFATNATRTFGTGAQTGELLQSVRRVPARPRRHGRQGLPIPAVHRQRVPARAVLPRSVDADRRSSRSIWACAGSTTRSCGGRITRSRCST